MLQLNIDFQIQVNQFDLFIEDIVNNATIAVRGGLDYLRIWNEAVVANWDHKPSFVPQNIYRTGIQEVGGYILCNDLIWQWVSLGTTPTSIGANRSSVPGAQFKWSQAYGWYMAGGAHQGRGVMAFQWSPPASGSMSLPGHGSYDPKSEGGSGMDSGTWRKTLAVERRFIRPRNFPEKALQGHEDFLFAYLQSIISP